MTFIGIKATAIQAIFEYTRKKATLFLKYTRKKATLFYHEPHLHPLFTTIQVLIQFGVLPKNQYEVMIQNLIYRYRTILLEFWMKSDLY